MSLLMRLKHFRAWPIDLLEAEELENLCQLIQGGKISVLTEGWVCLTDKLVSMNQLSHYRLTAEFFTTLQRADWLVGYIGEQMLRQKSSGWPFIPDGMAEVEREGVRKRLVVEVMNLRREYSDEKIRWTLQCGYIPVFVTKGVGERGRKNLRTRVGPFACIVTDDELRNNMWQKSMDSIWD
jgi:hypothetical protein